MRNYIDEIEAAYLTSRRQGDRMRDPARERSSHEDRRNRYMELQSQPGIQRHGPVTQPDEHALDTYRPAGSNYSEVLQPDHRGKGPRNYKRSDERIKEIVCDRLCDHPDLDASDIEVEVRDSNVILKGQVREKRDKRLAEDLAENVTGVANVENRIRVTSPAVKSLPR
ncbi:MAG TPA: BON domain-containing protein [Chryseosolibacter sp.]